MHRTLKVRTTRSPQQTLRAQQRRFDEFCQIYNHERPHEALGQETPASQYTASLREYPKTLEPARYSKHFEIDA